MCEKAGQATALCCGAADVASRGTVTLLLFSRMNQVKRSFSVYLEIAGEGEGAGLREGVWPGLGGGIALQMKPQCP